MRSKYNAQKVTADGIQFDSKKEYRRYCELKLLERTNEISQLEVHKKYQLIPVQREKKYNGFGKVIERAVTYEADFVYIDNRTGKTVIEDTKGYRTDAYKIKRKMMLYFHGIQIKEI